MRPKATIDSIESIDTLYSYYENHQQSQVFARLGHAVLSKVYRPEISFADDAEEAIADAISSETRLIISPNHLTGDDQYVIVSLAEKEEIFHPLRGRTFIPAEPSLFTASKKRGGQLLRRAVDGLGALPIYRMEDLRRLGLDDDTETVELYKYGMMRADQVEFAKLTRGISGNPDPFGCLDLPSIPKLPYEHMAGFWEGARNRVDHRKVQPLKTGIAHTACRAAGLVDVSVVPIGLYYGGEPKSYKKLDVPAKFKPTVHVGRPIPVNTSDPDKLVELVYPALQDCVDVAVAATAA